METFFEPGTTLLLELDKPDSEVLSTPRYTRDGAGRLCGALRPHQWPRASPKTETVLHEGPWVTLGSPTCLPEAPRSTGPIPPAKGLPARTVWGLWQQDETGAAPRCSTHRLCWAPRSRAHTPSACPSGYLFTLWPLHVPCLTYIVWAILNKPRSHRTAAPPPWASLPQPV